MSYDNIALTGGQTHFTGGEVGSVQCIVLRRRRNRISKFQYLCLYFFFMYLCGSNDAISSNSAEQKEF
jgi:hypothetical protein